MRRVLFLLLILAVPAIQLIAQSFDAGRYALSNYLIRMYKAEPFEGVRVVNDYDSCYYLVSAVTLNPASYKSEAIMNRVASVKATSQASRFLNGSMISSEMIIYTSDVKDSITQVNTMEKITESSIGYVNMLEQLASIKTREGMIAFLYYVRIPS